MTITTRAWLVYQPPQQSLLSEILDCARAHQATLEPVSLEAFLADPGSLLDKTRHLVALLEADDLGALLQVAHERGATVGLLPLDGRSKICRIFRIPETLKDAMPLALESDAGVKLDLLLCNGEAAVWMVTLGEVPFIEMRRPVYQQPNFLQRAKTVIANVPELFRLRPRAVSMTLGADSEIRTALVGAIFIENATESLAAHLVDETISALDGKLSAIFVAPSSVVDYLGFLAAAFVSKARPANRLPSAVSYVRMAEITLEAASEMDYYLDGRRRSSRSLSLRVLPKAVVVNVGSSYLETQKASEDDKDIIKIQALPHGAERLEQIKSRLPLFSAAQEEDFKDLFVVLRDYARPSVSFGLLMVLSALLATLGLFLNNAPVVIGAMLLAPLMGPVVSIAMGILRNDRSLLRGALGVFATGTGLTLLVAALTTLALPYEQATDEIRARLQPNLLDLGVAIVSGIAAAYAHAKENVHQSLPGVAIAVALVPPACVMGIGLGWGAWEVFRGAGLLFLANLSGIALAGALSFLCLGFSPVLRVTRGFGFSVLLAGLISVPLYHSFMHTAVYDRIAHTLGGRTYALRGKSITLSDVSVQQMEDKIAVSAQLHSREPVAAEDIAVLRDVIEVQLEQPVLLDVSLRLTQ